MRRKTRQRAAIEGVFRQAGRPLSAREVLDGAAVVTPGLGVATVYRTIHGLLEDGWLEAVTLPDEPPRYELSGKHHHEHFHCRGCARVFDVEDCPVLDPRVPSGFVLEGHSAVLRGLCAACSGGVDPSARDRSERADGCPAPAPSAHPARFASAVAASPSSTSGAAPPIPPLRGRSASAPCRGLPERARSAKLTQTGSSCSIVSSWHAI